MNNTPLVDILTNDVVTMLLGINLFMLIISFCLLIYQVHKVTVSSQQDTSSNRRKSSGIPANVVINPVVVPLHHHQRTSSTSLHLDTTIAGKHPEDTLRNSVYYAQKRLYIASFIMIIMQIFSVISDKWSFMYCEIEWKVVFLFYAIQRMLYFVFLRLKLKITYSSFGGFVNRMNYPFFVSVVSNLSLVAMGIVCFDMEFHPEQEDSCEFYPNQKATYIIGLFTICELTSNFWFYSLFIHPFKHAVYGYDPNDSRKIKWRRMTRINLICTTISTAASVAVMSFIVIYGYFHPNLVGNMFPLLTSYEILVTVICCSMMSKEYRESCKCRKKKPSLEIMVPPSPRRQSSPRESSPTGKIRSSSV